MSELIAAAKMITSSDMRSRVSACIRNVSATKVKEQSKGGDLARVCLMDPNVALDYFMVRIASDSTITSYACGACGNVDRTADGTADDAIQYVVTTSWDEVSNVVYQDRV